jgi:hypothetical protein
MGPVMNIAEVVKVVIHLSGGKLALVHDVLV